MKKNQPLILSAIILLLANVLFPGDPDIIKLEKISATQPLENLVFPDLDSITIDQKGNVFAFAGRTNGKECFIIKFDKNLSFIKTFGRSGLGPGEFKTTYSTIENRISIAPNGDVYVIDYNPLKLVIFDNNGIFKNEIPLMRKYQTSIGSVSNIKIVEDHVFIGRKYLGGQKRAGVIFTLNPPEIIIQYPFNEKRISVKAENGMMMLGATDFCYGDNYFIDTDSGRIVFGNSQVYKFHVYDSAGRLIIEAEKKGARMGTFSDKELGALGELLEDTKKSAPMLFKAFIKQVKQRKNVIADIKIYGERIYVFPVPDDISVPDKYPVEIYNLKGEIIKKGYLRRLPQKIWGDYIFYKERDDEDNPILLKFKMCD